MAQWCPRCGAEYVEGWGNCSTCNVPLADEPPAPRPQARPASRVSFLNPGGGRADTEDEFVAIWEGPTPEGREMGAKLAAAHIPVEYGEAAEPGRTRLEVPRSYIDEAYATLDVSTSVTQSYHRDAPADVRRSWSPAVKVAVAFVVLALVVVLVLSSA